MMVRIAELTLDHTDEWADLLSVAFGRAPAHMRLLLHWLHSGYPVIAVGAWSDDRLVAQYACIVRHLHMSPGGAVPVGVSVNMAVHPDYRGRGLVKQVSAPVYAALRMQGGVAGVGFSNFDGVQVDRHSRGYGYRVVGQLESLVTWVRRRRSVSTLALDADMPDASDPAVFAPSEQLRFVQSAPAVRHRYCQHPFRKYQIAVWQENGCLCGVVVYRQVRLMGFPAAALLSAYSVDLPELLARWTNTIAAAGIRLVHLTASPHSRVKHALAAHMPLISIPRTRTPYYLTVKPLSDVLGSVLTQYPLWDSTGGDVL